MTKEEKIKKINDLKKQATQLKREAEYYDASQLALKLVLNGSYGAFAAGYFILFNNLIAGSITYQGRELIKMMDSTNEDYWFNQWHLDFELHHKLGIKNVTNITKKDNVSIYCDTDSLFVSFKPAIKNCEWKDLLFNNEYLNNISNKTLILTDRALETTNPNIHISKNLDDFKNDVLNSYDNIIVDGKYIKNRDFNAIKNEFLKDIHISWNWSCELDFIQGMDTYRIADYFKFILEEYAAKYGVENKQDFELEKISESIINIAKKKYIQHIVHEDGIDHERMKYIFPKGVELIRSSTPLFARTKIVDIVKYLFSNPDTFNIKDLLKLVKNLRKEFELADIDDIALQSSCSKYSEKVIDDKNLPLKHVGGAHFAVKAASYYNFLLHKEPDLLQKYEYIKSGTKIKYYVCKDKKINDMFAYIRGSYPYEFAPEICYDTQFAKAILSPINSIIEPLGLPTITDRLTIVMDIFGGF